MLRCASPFVIATYVYVRLIPQGSRALPADFLRSRPKFKAFATFYESVIFPAPLLQVTGKETPAHRHCPRRRWGRARLQTMQTPMQADSLPEPCDQFQAEIEGLAVHTEKSGGKLFFEDLHDGLGLDQFRQPDHGAEHADVEK